MFDCNDDQNCFGYSKCQLAYRKERLAGRVAPYRPMTGFDSFWTFSIRLTKPNPITLEWCGERRWVRLDDAIVTVWTPLWGDE